MREADNNKTSDLAPPLLISDLSLLTFLFGGPCGYNFDPLKSW